MLSSLARYLEPLPEGEGDPFLTQIQNLFQCNFIIQRPADQDEGGVLNYSSGPMDAEDFPFDPHSIDMDRSEGGDSDDDRGSVEGAGWEVEPTAQMSNSEKEQSPVLHLGSVLLTGHDYLLWFHFDTMLTIM